MVESRNTAQHCESACGAVHSSSRLSCTAWSIVCWNVAWSTDAGLFACWTKLPWRFQSGGPSDLSSDRIHVLAPVQKILHDSLNKNEPNYPIEHLLERERTRNTRKPKLKLELIASTFEGQLHATVVDPLLEQLAVAFTRKGPRNM